MSNHPIRQRILQWLPMVFFVVAVLILIMSLGFLFIAMGDAQRLSTATAPTSANHFHLEQLEHQIAELSDELERKTDEMSKIALELNELNADVSTFVKPSNLPKMIQVDGTVYHIWGTPLERLFDLDKCESTGRITSIIAQSLTPAENNQANFDCDGQPYVWLDGNLFLKQKDGNWYRCSPW